MTAALPNKRWLGRFILRHFLQESVTLWMLLCGLIIVCGTALSANLLKFRH